jgi:hypothetical protein
MAGCEEVRCVVVARMQALAICFGSRFQGFVIVFHFWCPVPVQVRTDTQAYRETYREFRVLVNMLRHIEEALERKGES